MKLPKIFIISLNDSPRRDIIARRLAGLSLEFEFFDAVYGKALSNTALEKVDFDFYPQHCNAKKPLTLGEVGCAMSHIQLYEHLVKHNIQEAIILEDDAIVPIEFEKIVLDALRKVSSTYDILFLDHGKAKIYPFPRNLVERYRLAKYRRPSKNSNRTIIKTTGYILTLAGAKTLLNHAYPVRMPSDFLTGRLQLTKLNAYGIEPACIFGGVLMDSEINQIEDRYNVN